MGTRLQRCGFEEHSLISEVHNVPLIQIEAPG